ncbi:MAG: hypothetical protein P8Z75_11465 [Gammaproteobacteria bacterium]
MTKLKAFASHLGISFLIFLIILYFIIFKWYPFPFFSTDGGWQGIRIIIGVDLVLGPLLTLIVFKPGKPGLKFDLSVIAIMQAGALAWGIWTVHHQRPIAAVYVDNYFAPVMLYEIKGQDMTLAKLKKFGEHPPFWIYSKLPEDSNAMQKIRLEALQMGRPIFTFTKYYHAMDENAMKIMRSRSLDMEQWVKGKPGATSIYHHFMNRHHDRKGLIFIPWHARDKYVIIAMDSVTRKYVGILDIAPPMPQQKFPAIGKVKKNT